MKNKSLYKPLAKMFFLFSLVFTSAANAGLIFESAEYPQSAQKPNLGGLAIDDAYFVMHRFYLDNTYSLESIGGYFWADTGRTIFGAVVALTGEDDFPNSFDLTTSDVLVTTLLTIENVDGDYLGDLRFTLDSGWYAVAFGTGLYGADGISPNGVGLGMPALEADLSPDLPITGISAKNPYGVMPQFTYQLSTTRFIVNGSQSVDVPEPSAVYIFLVGIGLLSLSRKKNLVR